MYNNPYQGLKDGDLIFKSHSRKVAMYNNPYQGLKEKLQVGIREYR